MFIGYVSDETYAALADVVVDFERNNEWIATCRSSAQGRVDADIPPGPYQVTLNKTGYGAKSVDIEIEPGKTIQWRLLSDGLIGYMWPKWVKSGDRAEFRVHSPEPYRISIWRHGARKEQA